MTRETDVTRETGTARRHTPRGETPGRAAGPERGARETRRDEQEAPRGAARRLLLVLAVLAGTLGAAGVSTRPARAHAAVVGQAATALDQLSGGAQTTLPASGLSRPVGVAVNRAGDLYIADSGHNRVVEVLSVTTAGQTATAQAGQTATVVAGQTAQAQQTATAAAQQNPAATLTVTVCDKSHLDAAINNAHSGDTITFGCFGIITDNLTISKTLTLDATGQQVTLDGGHAGSVITVNSGVRLTLTALTLTHGAAGLGGGGGINNGGTLTLTNSAVSGNSADGAGGGIANFGTVTLRNTILARNNAPTGADCSGTLTSGGYNLLSDNSGCVFTPVTGDQVGTATSPIDPKLGPLQDNGVPTATQALSDTSPAIDVVPQTHLAGLTTDQRGLPRPDNGETTGDIGAYEAQDSAGSGGPGNGAATPELGSGELLATGLLPLGAALLYRRRRARRSPPR